MNVKIILIILTTTFLCFSADKKNAKDSTDQSVSSTVIDPVQKRINDSIFLEEFSKAEREWKLSQEKEKEIKKERENKAAKNDVINFNYKNSKNASLIDSLELRIKGLSRAIYDSDTIYKEMETLSFEDQLNYLDDIVKKNNSRSNEILQFYNKMYTVYNLEKEKQVLILETQQGNDRGLVTLHIKHTLEKLRKLDQEIVALKSTFNKKKPRKKARK